MRRLFGVAVAAMVIGLSGCATAGTEPPAAVVGTDAGPVRGTVAADHRSFQGIPYAAPPVGELRWGSPRPAPRWTEPRDATRPGDLCAQNPGILGERPGTSEDCLHLNVTTPRRSAGRALPVMVWIHGGGFRNGTGSAYDPTRMAVEGDVIVVTINYRLGAFGFLSHPALDGGTAEQMSGNFGIEDQQAALRWVQRNAAAFGGDAGNVTVFGESAGGASACIHLESPRSAGLFHRAIAQSGPCTMASWPAGGNWLPRPRAAAEQNASAIAGKLGCVDPEAVAACLRAVPAAQLLAKAGLEFGPVIGGPVLPLDPATALRTGAINKVPVMHGTTRDEHASFGARELVGIPAPTVAGYPKEIEAVFGKDKAPQILAEYPLATYENPSVGLYTAVTDALWARAAVVTNRLLAAQVPTFAYEFADRSAPWVTSARPLSYPTGAFHAAELNYLFAAEYFTGSRLTGDQDRLASQMIRYWTQFARTGDPNGPDSPPWNPSSTTSHDVLALAPGPDGIRSVDLDREHNGDFWRTLDG